MTPTAAPSRLWLTQSSVARRDAVILDALFCRSGSGLTRKPCLSQRHDKRTRTLAATCMAFVCCGRGSYG